uniref:Uncharacterized protein n=1 Tax=viral metagenome TaxID=1070528 RepID=A0A6M3X4F3_9ZZZZ
MTRYEVAEFCIFMGICLFLLIAVVSVVALLLGVGRVDVAWPVVQL